MTSGIGRRLPSALGLALLVLLVSRPSGAAEVEVYQPRHRPAAELAPLAQGLLGSRGTAVADPHSGKLILSGSETAVAQAIRALRELDTPLRQYRIEARVTSEEELRQRGFEIHGWLELGNLRIGRIRSADSGGRVVFRTLSTEGGELLLANILVLEGRTAEIWTGTDQPVYLRVFRKRDTDERILETTPLAPIRSGFQLRPRSLGGGSVELEVVAVIEEETPYGKRVEAFAHTRVNLAPGEEVVVAETRREGTEVHTFPYTTHQQAEYASDTLVWVRVSSEDSGPRP